MDEKQPVVWTGPPLQEDENGGFIITWDASGIRRVSIPTRWWELRKRIRKYRERGQTPQGEGK